MVKAKNMLLKAGLTYSLRLKGNSIRLQAGFGGNLDLILNVFIIIKFINEAIKTPPKYTKPLISELNIEINTRNEASKIGAIDAENCKILLKLSCIAILSYIYTFEDLNSHK